MPAVRHKPGQGTWEAAEFRLDEDGKHWLAQIREVPP
jgi:hypothetical protein